MKSISDKAEVSVDFPDKTYMGSFGRESSFDVTVEADEVLLRMVRAGEERREIAVHLHFTCSPTFSRRSARGCRGRTSWMTRIAKPSVSAWRH